MSASCVSAPSYRLCVVMSSRSSAEACENRSVVDLMRASHARRTAEQAASSCHARKGRGGDDASSAALFLRDPFAPKIRGYCDGVTVSVAPDVSPTVNNSPLQPSTSIPHPSTSPCRALQLYSPLQPSTAIQLCGFTSSTRSTTLYNSVNSQHPSESRAHV